MLSEQTSRPPHVFAVGFAMFSMFFGAGNVVFPLSIGQYAQDQNFYAIVGLLISAVGVPFLGLLAMTLFEGNYQAFFGRIGRWLGFTVAALIMGLIGPFGGIPRCITLSFSTIQEYLSGIHLIVFSLVACLIIFILTIKKSKIVDILGYYLTPFLILALAIIVVVAIYLAPVVPKSEHATTSIFVKGLVEGYQTMDLMAAFFFSTIALAALKPASSNTKLRMLPLALKASIVGAGLLAIVYIGFSYTAAYHSAGLIDVEKDLLLAKVSTHTLGPYAGGVACVAVALACLTTAIALSAVFAEFLQNKVFGGKISYGLSLGTTLIVAFLISTLHFTGIVALLFPVLVVCYPGLIVLTICNILYKLYGVQTVKTPVFMTFAITLATYISINYLIPLFF